VGKTVTLAVDRQQAERLALGSELGDLTLALRGVGDDDMTEEKWPTTTDARMTGIREEIFDEYEKMKQETGTGVKRSVVKIYNGSQIQEVPVR
jgi:Flp pilus assembly protein CpaB